MPGDDINYTRCVKFAMEIEVNVLDSANLANQVTGVEPVDRNNLDISHHLTLTVKFEHEIITESVKGTI